MMEDITKLFQGLCKVSMCDPESTTDFDFLDQVYNDYRKEKFIIEFGTLKPKIFVEVNQLIKLDDVIAEMDGMPVKSKVCGRITEITDRYIIGIYSTNADELLELYNLSENMTDNDIIKQFNLNI